MSYATLFSLSGILIVAVYVPILYFVLTKGRSKITKLFAAHLFCVIVWGIACFLIGLSRNSDITSEIFRLADFGVTLIPVLFLHVVHLMLGEKNKIFLYFAYAQTMFFFSILLLDNMTTSDKFMFNSFYYAQGGPFYLPWFLLWVLTVTIAHLKLIQHYKITYPQQKRQIFVLLLAMPIGFGGGSMNFLPGLGINIFPFGNFLVPIYGLILAYAILKHQLLDIVIVIKKSVVYSILIALISIIYLLTVLLLEKFAQGIFRYSSLLLSIGTAFGLGLIFVPLRHQIQIFVDRYFFKGTHEEIFRQNEQLRQEIAQSDKYKTLSTLASGVAHEIKNPLTSIKTFTEYLPKKLEDKEFLLKFSKLVGREVDRIDHMVHELLDYSKPAPLALKKTDINKLIQDTLNTLNSQFIKNRIEIIFQSSVTPDAPTYINPRKKSGVGTPTSAQAERRSYHLIIDANRIRQALLNLFLNAIDAMPTGGKLIVSTRVKGQGSSSKGLEIVIQDTGPGISPEDLKHIFDPFFSRKDKGTGLGLAIVQGIVEQHRGKIKIESQVGVGTTVKVQLPIEEVTKS